MDANTPTLAPTAPTPNPSIVTGASPMQTNALTQAPVTNAPDPYVWLPADNPLIGQTQREVSRPVPSADDGAATNEKSATWQWREAIIGLAVGAVIGASLGALAFKAVSTFKAG